MLRTFEYRLYPNREQQRRLIGCLIESRLLYNAMLEAVKKNYETTKKFLDKYALNKIFRGNDGNGIVPATTVQCLSDRLEKALRAFVRKRKNGEKAGFPRFKKPNQWHSIQLRQNKADFLLDPMDGSILLPKKLSGPKRLVRIKFHRPFEGTPKTCHLVLRCGRWHVLVVCSIKKDLPACEPDCVHKEIGIDVGLKTFLTDSEGKTIENPRFYRTSQRQLRIKQRRMDRRKNGSHRHKKAARLVAQHHLKIKRLRKDHHFKIAGDYAKGCKLLAVEGLDIANMARGYLSKSVQDAGWGQFISILKDKAESAGHEVVEVDPAYTSQECNKCGEIVQKSLSVRTHICPYCGYVADRDVNAAKNILARARAIKQAGARPSDVKLDDGLVGPRNRCCKAGEVVTTTCMTLEQEL